MLAYFARAIEAAEARGIERAAQALEAIEYGLWGGQHRLGYDDAKKAGATAIRALAAPQEKKEPE